MKKSAAGFCPERNMAEKNRQEYVLVYAVAYTTLHSDFDIYLVEDLMLVLYLI